MSETFLIFCAIVFLQANLVFYLAGAYVMLFRTASNDSIPPRSKLHWMWLQAVFPITSLGYILFVEKSLVLRLTIATTLALSIGIVSFIANKIPRDKIDHFVATIEQDLADEKQKKAVHAQRLSDPLWKKAALLSKQLKAKADAAQTDADKAIAKQANRAMLRMQIAYMNDKLTQEQFASLLQTLETDLKAPAYTKELESAWEAQITTPKPAAVPIQQATPAPVQQEAQPQTAWPVEQDIYKQTIPPQMERFFTDQEKQMILSMTAYEPTCPEAQRAHEIAEHIQTMQATDTGIANQRIFAKTWLLVKLLESKANQNILSKDPAKIADNQKIRQLIDELNNSLIGGALTAGEFIQWVQSYRNDYPTF